MIEAIAPFLEGTVRTATPLAFAALGETIAERSGVINIGLEGSLICGALGGLVAAGYGSTWTGFVVAGISGAAIALVFAVFVTTLRSNQIITGTAITLLALGLTGTLYRQMYGSTGAALQISTMQPLSIPMLSSIPLIGQALFAQPPVTYVLYFLIPLAWWWLYRTHSGLALRAVGENPEAAIAAGVPAARFQFVAILFGGFMGGVAGGVLVIAQVGTFAEGMSAGRGFIAIAIVVLGRWHPIGVAVAALVFGAASALQYLFQSMGYSWPCHIC
jgi:ABC-type uncharacterized transport system permease subunit